jgi:hypothetical protein
MKNIFSVIVFSSLTAWITNSTSDVISRAIEKTESSIALIMTTKESSKTPEFSNPMESTSLPLQTTGPYLISLNYSSGSFHFHLLDSDGSGQKDIIPSDEIQNQVNESGFIFTVELSEDGRWIGFVGGDHYYLFDVANEEFVHLSRYANILAGLSKYDIELGLSFSGDSKWLVFLDGEDIESCSNPEPYPCRVYLNVMRLADQKIVWRTNILPADFPNNFERLLDSIIGPPAEERESVYAGVMATF